VGRGLLVGVSKISDGFQQTAILPPTLLPKNERTILVPFNPHHPAFSFFEPVPSKLNRPAFPFPALVVLGPTWDASIVVRVKFLMPGPASAGPHRFFFCRIAARPYFSLEVPCRAGSIVAFFPPVIHGGDGGGNRLGFAASGPRRPPLFLSSGL